MQDNDVIDFSDANYNWRIQLDTYPSSIDYVDWQLSGDVTETGQDNSAPYEVVSSQVFFLNALNLPTGSYQLTLTPYDANGPGPSRVLNFTVIDSSTIPPQLAALNPFSPANGAVNIDPALESISVTFNEPVQRGSSGTVTLYENGVNVYEFPITSEAAVMFDSQTVTIDLTAAVVAASEGVMGAAFENGTLLDAGKTYAVQISPGAVEDLEGNPFAGITENTVWSFSTVPRYDVNGDGFITPADALFVINRVDDPPTGPDSTADIDLDGDIDTDDVNAVLERVGEPGTPD